MNIFSERNTRVSQSSTYIFIFSPMKDPKMVFFIFIFRLYRYIQHYLLSCFRRCFYFFAHLFFISRFFSLVFPNIGILISVPDMLPSDKFPKFVPVFPGKKEENLGKSCSIRTALTIPNTINPYSGGARRGQISYNFLWTATA